MQPSPSRNPGGDCFACAVKMVVDYYYPEKPIDFNKVWECFESDGKCSFVGCGRESSKHLRNNWSGMYSAFQELYVLDYEFDWQVDIVVPEIRESTFSHSFGWSVPEMQWHRRVTNWLAAGWLILIEMSYDAANYADMTLKNHKHWSTDHFAVIDGQREFWHDYPKKEDGSYAGAIGKHETHVVCSGKGPYWIDTGDLHYYHGVNAFYAVRRKKHRAHRNPSWDMSEENQKKITD